MFVRHSKHFMKYFTKPWVSGIALFPFVLFRDEHSLKNKALVNHELIHIRQQGELLILPFYIWYMIEYGLKTLYYKDSFEAYKNISFEREAYANECDLDYLKKRPFWAFLKYI